MKYANEFKVGVTIIVAGIIFVLGMRYFQDLPLFRGTYSLAAEFDQAGGLIPGNQVRINGVVVGGIDEVFINPTNQRVRVNFHVDSNIPVTEGSYVQIAGFDALGVVRMDLIPGSLEAARLPEGWVLPGHEAADLIGPLTETGPRILLRVDSVLAGLESMIATTDGMLSEPRSDLRRTISSVQASVEILERFLESEKAHLGGILKNVESLTGNLDQITAENADSVTVLISNLSAVLTRLDTSLASMDRMSETLSEILTKVNDGDGTLGRLVNDPAMYEKMDSLLTGLNSLITDFQAHPDKYLKELRLVDIL